MVACSTAPSLSCDPGEPLARAGPGWRALPIALWPIMAHGEMTDHYRDTPILLVARSGLGRRWYKVGLARRELRTAPRMVELYGAGFALDRGRWEGTAGECVGVEFPVATIARFLGDEAQHFDPPTRHEIFYEPLAALAFALWEEAACGAPNGTLFADGLSLALLGLMGSRYLTRQTARHGPQRLSRRATAAG